MDYATVLQRIAGLRTGGRPQTWHGRCPCSSAHSHGDRSGSLRLWIAEDGSLRVKCFKGCKWRDIAAALQTSASDWYPRKCGLTIRGRKPTAMQGEIVATYDYEDEQGQLLFQAVRTRMPDGSKGFYQRRPMPGGGWASTLGPGWFKREGENWWIVSGAGDEPAMSGCVQVLSARLVPYRLPQLLAKPDAPVIVVEGEKDVQTLEALFAGGKLCVTCNPAGAKKWPWSFGKWLKGRRVTIIPDYDEPGFEHGCLVSASAIAYGCESVRMVRWPDTTAPKTDITDWLNMPERKDLTVADKRKAVGELIKSASEEYKRAA